MASTIDQGCSDAMTYSVHFLNAAIMCNHQIRKLGQELFGCRLANKKPNMVEGVRSPRDKNQETNEDSTNRIDIPDNSASNNGHGQTEGVDDNVVTMVDEEDMNRRVAAEDEAIGTQ